MKFSDIVGRLSALIEVAPASRTPRPDILPSSATQGPSRSSTPSSDSQQLVLPTGDPLAPRRSSSPDLPSIITFKDSIPPLDWTHEKATWNDDYSTVHAYDKVWSLNNWDPENPTYAMRRFARGYLPGDSTYLGPKHKPKGGMSANYAYVWMDPQPCPEQARQLTSARDTITQGNDKALIYQSLTTNSSAVEHYSVDDSDKGKILEIEEMTPEEEAAYDEQNKAVARTDGMEKTDTQWSRSSQRYFEGMGDPNDWVVQVGVMSSANPEGTSRYSPGHFAVRLGDLDPTKGDEVRLTKAGDLQVRFNHHTLLEWQTNNSYGLSNTRPRILTSVTLTRPQKARGGPAGLPFQNPIDGSAYAGSEGSIIQGTNTYVAWEEVPYGMRLPEAPRDWDSNGSMGQPSRFQEVWQGPDQISAFEPLREQVEIDGRQMIESA